MKKTYIGLLALIATLSFACTVKAETKDIPLVNGVSEIERTVYNIHFSDGTTKFVTGPLKHSGGDLSPEIKKQIDDFFAKKAIEWKASLKMTTDDGTRNIDAITPTHVRLSIVSISFGDTNYIRVAPITVDHKHGSTAAHKEKVETLWNPLKSVKKAADKTIKTVKKGADKAVDLGKKAAPYAVTAVKGLAPAIIKTVPEAIAGASSGSTLGSSIGGSVGGAIGSVIPGVGNLTGAIAGIGAGAIIGGAAGVLIPVGKNLIPAAYNTTKDLKKEKEKSKDKKKDKKKKKK